MTHDPRVAEVNGLLDNPTWTLEQEDQASELFSSLMSDYRKAQRALVAEQGGEAEPVGFLAELLALLAPLLLQLLQKLIDRLFS